MSPLGCPHVSSPRDARRSRLCSASPRAPSSCASARRGNEFGSSATATPRSATGGKTPSAQLRFCHQTPPVHVHAWGVRLERPLDFLDLTRLQRAFALGVRKPRARAARGPWRAATTGSRPPRLRASSGKTKPCFRCFAAPRRRAREARASNRVSSFDKTVLSKLLYLCGRTSIRADN